jgi:hypothetical protein
VLQKGGGEAVVVEKCGQGVLCMVRLDGQEGQEGQVGAWFRLEVLVSIVHGE